MAYAKAKYNFSKKVKKGIFQEYDYKWVQFLLNLLSPYATSRVLLQREYGENLDGVGAKCDLSYKEHQHLQVSVKIFEERLQCIAILVNRGESIQSIQKRFMAKNDEQIEQMVKKILQENNKKEMVPLQTKREILNQYQINSKTLDAAIELLEDGDDRILYKYTYKIGTNGMTKEELLQFFGLNEVEYNHRLLQIEAKLPKLIDEVKENKINLKEEDWKMKESQKKYEQKPTTSKRKKELQVTIDFKENFSDLAYTDFYFQQVLSYRKSVAPRIFDLLTELYGKELDEKLNNFYVNNTKASMIEKEIETIRELLKSKKLLNGYYLTNTFLELFQTEENKDTLTLEDVVVRIDKSMIVCQLLQKIYGEEFNEMRKEVSLTYTDKRYIEVFVKRKVKELDEIRTVSFKKNFEDNFRDISYTDFYLEQVLSYRKSVAPQTMTLLTELYGKELDEALNLKKLNRGKISIIQGEIRTIRRLLATRTLLNGSYLPNTFLELFQTEENRDHITVESILQRKKEDTSIYDLLRTIYGQNFDEIKKEVFLTKEQKKAIHQFVSTTVKEIQMETAFPFADYFKDHFDLANVEEEVWQECLTMQACKAKKTYKKLEKIYGKGLKEQAIKRNIPMTHCNEIRSFIRSLDRQLLQMKNQQPTEKVYFEDIFIKDMDAEMAQKVRKRVKALLSLQQSTEGYVAAQLLFGERLDEPRKKVVLSSPQSFSYKSLLYYLQKMLASETTIYDYFYTEKEKTQENIEQFHTILKSYQEEYPEQYKGLMELFDEDNYVLVDRFSPEQKNLLLLVKGYLREKLLTNSFTKLEDFNRKDGRMFYTFIEYFVQEDMSDAEKEETKKVMHYFIDTYISANHNGYRVAQKLFGVHLEEERKQVVLNQEERENLKIFVSAIRRYLVKRKVVRMRPNYFVDVFTTYDTSIEEREWIAKEIPMILKSIPKDTKYYQAGAKLYGSTLGEKRADVKLSDLEGISYAHLIRVIQASLDEKKKNLYFGERIKEEQGETDFSSIQSVLEKHFDVIEEVLQVEPFKMLMNTVTEIEQELIYLKLVQRKDPSLTDEMISRITNIPLEEIHSYEIMTKNDLLNSLNQYIKVKN